MGERRKGAMRIKLLAWSPPPGSRQWYGRKEAFRGKVREPNTSRNYAEVLASIQTTDTRNKRERKSFNLDSERTQLCSDYVRMVGENSAKRKYSIPLKDWLILKSVLPS